MKNCLLILALLVSCVPHVAGSSTNILSVCLVAPASSRQWPTVITGKSDKFKLLSPPVLADADFVAFDTTNHTFVITPESAKRLARNLWNWGRQHGYSVWGETPTVYPTGDYDLIPTPAPFVLIASGEQVYGGAFYTYLSSSSFEGPVFLPDMPFISTNLTSNVTFRIEPGYPGPFPDGLKLRSDSRIASAVQKLFAHDKK